MCNRFAEFIISNKRPMRDLNYHRLALPNKLFYRDFHRHYHHYRHRHHHYYYFDYYNYDYCY